MDIIISIGAKIAEYLVVPVGRQFGYLLCYKTNIQDLRNEVPIFEGVRAGVKGQVEAADRNGEFIFQNVSDWLTSTSEVEEESRKFLDDELNSNMRCFKGYCPDLVMRHQQSRKAKKTVAMINKLKQDAKFDKVSYPAPPPTIASNFNEDENLSFHSRKVMFENIMGALKDDSINMIGICGTGGIGKTTLVNRVGVQAEAEKLFDVVATAVVSQSPNLRSIHGKIADMLGLHFKEESDEGRARTLSEQIMKKKSILIILDDIWEKLKLEAVGIPVGSKHRGCKIVLTSRSKDVCNQMDSQKIMDVSVLSQEESFILFKKIAGETMESANILPTAVEVVKECAGLPLAIATVASALKGRDLNSWKDAATRLMKSDLYEPIFLSLKLSYDYLKRAEARSFFLLCCLFPEDFDVPIEVLCRFGMGLKVFQGVENMNEARTRAFVLSSDLKSSYLLLESSEEDCVKMHDVVRDFALSIASEGENVFLVKAGLEWTELPNEDVLKRFTAISLISENFGTLPDVLECPKLKVLLLELNTPLAKVPSNFFLRTIQLKVLTFTDMKLPQLPQSFQNLKNLHTLCFKRCLLGDLSLIGQLQTLEILSICESIIKMLPKEIGNLAKLRLLDLKECHSLKVIAPGVLKKLVKLEELYMKDGFKGWEKERDKTNASLEELNSLSKLTTLEIDIPNINVCPYFSLSDKITCYTIWIGYKSFKSNSSNQYTILSNPSKPYSKKFEYHCNDVGILSKEALNKLVKTSEYIYMWGIKGVNNFLSASEENLKSLFLSNCGDMEYIWNTENCISKTPFPSLNSLILKFLDDLKEICHGKPPAGFFNGLKKVQVSSCDRLTSIFSNCMVKDFSELVKLKVSSCNNMQAIFESEEDASTMEYMFPSLHWLQIIDLPKLKFFYFNKNFLSPEQCLFMEQAC